jgi:hypothetical protein
MKLSKLLLISLAFILSACGGVRYDGSDNPADGGRKGWDFFFFKRHNP